MTQTRMTTRLPKGLADALAARAQANHRSVNGELCAILSEVLKGVYPGGHYAPDGTLMNANGTRSIFDDVDQ